MGQPVKGKLLFQPHMLIASPLQIVGEQAAVADENNGQACFLRGEPHLGSGDRPLACIGQYGEFSVGLQHGKFDRFEISIALSTEFFQQFVNGNAVFPQFRLLDYTIFHHNRRLSAQKGAKA